MSQLNINRNIFLEKEELLRFQEFLIDSPVNQTFFANTLTWGIIDTSGGTTPNDFSVTAGSTSGTVRIQYLSRALTSSKLIIKQSPLDNIAVPSGGAYYWMKISHTYSNLEEGVCAVTADGQVAGTGTFFTEVLRGQSTEVPVKIKFPNSVSNSGIYEVVDVTDDNNIILSGTGFVAESNLTYAVIGSTPLGDTITSQQQQGLYFYDSCQIDLVAETVSNTEPAGKVANEEFWIARVVNNAGTVTIEDKRTEYWQYYIRGVSDKLSASANLSDLNDFATARQNLGVMSITDINTNLSNYLAKNNTTSYTPSSNYNPATKLYVDNVAGQFLTKGLVSIPDISADLKLTVNFSSAISTSDYVVVGFLISTGSNWDNDNDVIWTAKSMTTTGFDLLLHETIGNVQSLQFKYKILQY